MEPGEFMRLFRESEERMSRRVGSEVAVQIRESEDRIKSQMKMHFEEMQSQVQLAAEGYGANLERIERELVDLNRKMDTKFANHDQILGNHNSRITALESKG